MHAILTNQIADKSILTLSWRRPLSYRNQFIDLPCKSLDWFLYDNGFRHERVNDKSIYTIAPIYSNSYQYSTAFASENAGELWSKWKH